MTLDFFCVRAGEPKFLPRRLSGSRDKVPVQKGVLTPGLRKESMGIPKPKTCTASNPIARLIILWLYMVM